MIIYPTLLHTQSLDQSSTPSLFFTPPSLMIQSSSYILNHNENRYQQQMMRRTSKRQQYRPRNLFMTIFDDHEDDEETNACSNNNNDTKKSDNCTNISNSNENYDEFLQDLSKAKSEKLGMDIPTSSKQIQESIQNSQNEFLDAMKQAKIEFDQSKEEIGVDGAIEKLKEGWDEEDRLWEIQRELENGVYDSLDEVMDDDESRGNVFQ